MFYVIGGVVNLNEQRANKFNLRMKLLCAHCAMRILRYSVKYRVFIKYCVFLKILKYIPDSMASLGLPSVPVSVHNGRSNASAAAELEEFRKITIF